MNDFSFCWFASGGHAYYTIKVAKMFRKSSIVTLGGFEVAKVPELNYGSVLDPYRYRQTKYVLENATWILAVDESLKEDAIINYGIEGKNILIVPTGYDAGYFTPDGEKRNIVMTVAYMNESSIKRKGIETFIKAAAAFPLTPFIIIGKLADDYANNLKESAPPNVVFEGYVTDEILLKYYQCSKVYCQLSRYEGLPNSLCEAMLCECVPVGTPHCGIPKAIGNTGYYTEYGDVNLTVAAIDKALNGDGHAARERIRSMFPFDGREQQLQDIIRNLA